MQRLKKFRELMAENDLDGFLVTAAENRRYLSGFTGSSGVLLITGEEAVLLTDFRYLEQAAAQTRDYGFAVRKHEPEIRQTVAAILAESPGKRWGFESEDLVEKDYRFLTENNPSLRLIPTEGLVAKLRMIKSAEEIELIRRAVAITDQAWAELLPEIKAGRKEFEIAALFEYIQRRLGAAGASFETIVASGPRSALPHGVAGDRILEKGDLVVLDGGAVYNGYCSDFTRTVAVGEPDPEAEKIYNIVLEAQERALKGIRPGMTGRQVDALAREVIKEAGYGEYFGHGLGHSLGLAVHEDPRLSPRDETVLSPGMVFTVEPGIYLPGRGGVRIEDVVVVTEDGCQNLTRSAKNIRIAGW